MKPPILRFPLLLAFLTLSTLPAQKTWIVDQKGGSGSNFKDLPPAIAIAKDGDIIRIRPGLYQPTLIQGKGLTILGGPGVFVSQKAPNPGFEVRGLPATSKMRIKGLQFVDGIYSTLRTQVTLKSCKGSVLLEECLITPSNVFKNYFSLVASQCSEVILNSCIFRRGVWVDNSHFVSNASLFYDDPGQPSTGAAGVLVKNSIIELNQATILAGTNGGTFVDPSPYGVDATNTRIIVRGNSRSLIRGGIFGAKILPGFFNRGGSEIIIDPQVRYNGNLNSFGIKALTKEMPSITVRSSKLGGTIQGEMFPPRNRPYILWSGLAGKKIPSPFFGNFWLNPSFFFPLSAGMLLKRKDFPFAVPIPNQKPLLGLTLGFQSLSWDKLFNFQLSNPAFTIVGSGF